MKKKKGTGKKSAASQRLGKKIPQQKSIEVAVVYEKTPASSKDREIHSREALPPLKKGKATIDETPTPKIRIG